MKVHKKYLLKGSQPGRLVGLRTQVCLALSNVCVFHYNNKFQKCGKCTNKKIAAESPERDKCLILTACS